MAQININMDDSLDPFYCEKNVNVLLEIIKDANDGKLSEHELIEE